MLTSLNFKKFEEQRQAAAKAARQMSARSHFYDAESDGEGESDEFESSDDFGCAETGMSQKLRQAVMAFNIKCDEDGCRFQWFQETIDGPLEVLQVRAEHRKACDLCDTKPTLGEVYFR